MFPSGEIGRESQGRRIHGRAINDSRGLELAVPDRGSGQKRKDRNKDKPSRHPPRPDENRPGSKRSRTKVRPPQLARAAVQSNIREAKRPLSSLTSPWSGPAGTYGPAGPPQLAASLSSSLQAIFVAAAKAHPTPSSYKKKLDYIQSSCEEVALRWPIRRPCRSEDLYCAPRG
jgi:hypothetical protein